MTGSQGNRTGSFGMIWGRFPLKVLGLNGVISVKIF